MAVRKIGRSLKSPRREGPMKKTLFILPAILIVVFLLFSCPPPGGGGSSVTVTVTDMSTHYRQEPGLGRRLVPWVCPTSGGGDYQKRLPVYQSDRLPGIPGCHYGGKWQRGVRGDSAVTAIGVWFNKQAFVLLRPALCLGEFLHQAVHHFSTADHGPGDIFHRTERYFGGWPRLWGDWSGFLTGLF